MTRRFALLASTLLGAAFAAAVSAPSAQAQPINGVYVSLGGGGNVLQDQQSRYSPGLNLSGRQFNYNVGAVGLGSVGYGFGNGLRVEIEGDYRFNALHRFGGSPFPANSGGDQQEYGVMANALFDLDIGSPYVFPYFGVGLGYAHTDLDHFYAAGASTRSTFAAGGDGTNSMGYQGIIGVSFPTPWVPGLSVTTEYRFFGVVDDQSYNGRVVTPMNTQRGEVRLFNDYNHSVLLGLRYAFNPAPPPVEPSPVTPPVAAAPAPAPARTYLVFFDWDRAVLTERARQIVAEAAQASTRVQTTRIEVNGYTDLSGTVAYNQKLSMRRAEVVTAELVRDGVARNEIAVRGLGESNPIVPTAQGVREPQNRRVEIILK